MQSFKVDRAETIFWKLQQALERRKMFDSSQSDGNVRIELCLRKHLPVRSSSSSLVLGLLNFALIGCAISLPVLLLASFVAGDGLGGLE